MRENRKGKQEQGKEKKNLGSTFQTDSLGVVVVTAGSFPTATDLEYSYGVNSVSKSPELQCVELS